MLNINIPGTGDILIKNILLDYNGTIAIDGSLINGVREKINHYANSLAFHVITADTSDLSKKNLKM